MPLYEYRCPQHGLFDQLVMVSEHGEQSPCPHCGALSPKVITTPPRTTLLTAAQREAYTRNERAAHEPRRGNLVTEREEHRQVHQPLHKSGTLYTADGKKMFPASRPWMLGH